MQEANRPGLFERLKHSVQLLANPSVIQLRMLPDFACKSDELALDFDNWRLAVIANFQAELTAGQLNCLAELKLEFMKMGKDAWSDEAVINGAEWRRIREVAAETLKEFGWPLEIPLSYAHEYVPGAQINSTREK